MLKKETALSIEPETSGVLHQPGRRRNRWALMLLAGVFFGSAAVAGLLRFSGWQPPVTRNHGQLLQPAVDARPLSPVGQDGLDVGWEPAARRWSVVVPAEPQCQAECVDLSQDLAKVWQLLGHNADNVRFLWLGSAPDNAGLPAGWTQLSPSPALRAVLPGTPDPSGTPVYVVDPNGFVILRYAPGFDPAGLRADLAKLLKLK